ncbi:MAG: Unknown protein [uncultured Sulfurovum sp.]|uniref:Uncharacterized protein n=1 Tax=uncultured Sulfurovum sp. TaxID=269237 RepID=A0A6S6T7Q8_9BACT|nr:MAG: Unknown protein [uncultured Sulfurovum sp.]
MKFLIVVAPIVTIVLIYLKYRRDDNLKKVIISFVLLWAMITLGVMGTMMLSIKPLYLTHWLAIVIAYIGMMVYILKDKFIWQVLIMPVITMFIYLILTWIGNEHVPTLV